MVLYQIISAEKCSKMLYKRSRSAIHRSGGDRQSQADLFSANLGFCALFFDRSRPGADAAELVNR